MMESDSSSSNDSSSDSSMTFQPPAAPMYSSNMPVAPQRSKREKQLIDEAADSFLSVLDRFCPILTETEYAFYCRYGANCLYNMMEKATRKVNKSFMETTFGPSDSASVAGSMRSGLHVPLNQLYPSNIAQIPQFVRPRPLAPSVVDSYVRQQGFEPVAHQLMRSGHSSGYSSSAPSNGLDHLNRTGLNSVYNLEIYHRPQQLVPNQRGYNRPGNVLMQAIDESAEISVSPDPEEPQVLNRGLLSKSQHQRPEIQKRPSSPDSSESEADAEPDQPRQNPKKNKTNTAVPKQRKDVVELKKWSVKLRGEELFVTGITRDKTQITSGSVTKYSHPTIITTKGNYQVIGEASHKERIPEFVRNACSKGFPRMWKTLSRKWFDARQSRSENSASKPTPNTSGKLEDSKSKVGRKPLNKEHGSDTSWDMSSAAQANESSKVASLIKPTEVIPKTTNKTQGSSKVQPTSNKESVTKQTSKAQRTQASPKASTSKGTDGNPKPQNKVQSNKSKPSSKKESEATIPKKQSKSKAKQPPSDTQESEAPPKKSSKSNAKQHATADEETEKPTKSRSIFGDSPDPRTKYVSDDLFACVGDPGYAQLQSRSMTPNTLLASIQPDAGTVGRFTPPMQAIQHLFPSTHGNKSICSTFGSPPRCLDRENHVSRRVAKDVVAKENGIKKKRKMQELPEFEDFVKSHKSQPVDLAKSPIIKEARRNSSSEDESNADESVAY